MTTGLCRPCPMVEAPPQGPRWELRGQRHRSGGASPHTGHQGEFWQQRLEMLFRGDSFWRTGPHVDSRSTHSLGAAGVGLGVLSSPRPPDPRRGGFGRLGGEGGRLCPPASSWARRRLFSGAPPPPPGCCWMQAFWSVFAAGEAAPSSGSPHPLHPSWCPGFPRPRGDLASPAKGRRLCGLGGSPQPSPAAAGYAFRPRPCSLCLAGSV